MIASGWPDLLQRDLEIIDGDWEGWSMLGSYENGSESYGWGPGGNLYFMLRDKDLAKRRFSHADVEMQCT